MVQSISFFQNLSNYLPLSNTLKGKSGSSSALNVALPIILSCLTYALLNNKKENELILPQKDRNIDLNSIEYSAWARLNDLKTHNDEKENSLISRDSNKWNEVFRQK